MDNDTWDKFVSGSLKDSEESVKKESVVKMPIVKVPKVKNVKKNDPKRYTEGMLSNESQKKKDLEECGLFLRKTLELDKIQKKKKM